MFCLTFSLGWALAGAVAAIWLVSLDDTADRSRPVYMPEERASPVVTPPVAEETPSRPITLLARHVGRALSRFLNRG